MGHGDSTNIISLQDFDFLLSMVDGLYMHLGYEVAVSISHQEADPRIGALFVSPYITHLVRHLGALQETNRMRVVGGMAPMSLEILQ